MITYACANKILNLITNYDTTTGSKADTLGYAKVMLGLSSTAPNQNGGNFTEPTADPSYKRVNVGEPYTYFPIASANDGGSITNQKDIVICRASIDWTNNISHAGIFGYPTESTPDSSATLLWYGELLNASGTATTVEVHANDIVCIAGPNTTPGEGSIKLQISGITTGTNQGNITDLWKAKIINAILARETGLRPSGTSGTNPQYKAPWIALSTSTPQPSQSGEISGTAYTNWNFTEPAQSEYERQYSVITNGSTTQKYFGNASEGKTQNTQYFIYNRCQSNWSPITYAGLFTSKTSGELIWYGQLTNSITPAQNQISLIEAGNLKLGLDANLND